MIISLHPRIFRRKISSSSDNINSALLYLFISCFISSVLQNLFFLNNEFFDKAIISCLLLLVLSTVLCGVILHFTWYFFTKKISFDEVSVTYFYHSGTWNIYSMLSLLLMSICNNIYLGFSVKDSLSFNFDIINGYKYGLSHPEKSMVVGLVYFFLSVPLLVWGINAWFAYCNIFRARRIISIMSLILYCVFSVVLITLFSFLYVNIYSLL